MAIALALVVAWFAMGWLFNGHVERRVEDELLVQVRPLLADLQLARGVPVAGSEPADPRFAVPAGGLYWQVSTAKGAIRSVSLWDSRLPHPVAAPAGTWRVRRADGPFGQRLLLMERAIRLQPHEPAVIVQLGYDLAKLAPAQREFGREMALFLALLWTVLALAAWAQVGLGLRPLRRVGHEVERLRRDASARLGGGGYPRELAPLTESIDALADAREADLVRARRRAADLAHGLKTPLAALAVQSARARESGEVLIADGLDSSIAAVRAAIDGELARTRISLVPEGRSTAALPLIERLITVIEQTEAGERVAFSLACANDATLPLAGDDAAELLGPLLENAARHARRLVHVAVDTIGEQRLLIVGDDGSGLDTAQRDEAILRGARLDSADEGHGLGLAIARELAEATRGKLTLLRSPLGGLEVRVRWPLSG
ncbi:signal transduction histidine kinase [Sphingopyxis panaciterrae]|uniref:ATP-binding protein n=1 Tax=Sphingopyxis panaciterrae TaxID=363841 RepID=UPI001ABB700A|nr:signal transduction histidine kinase [Sphingopyxis panaciterrae]